MAESVRELIVSLSLDAGNFSKTCNDINGQIKNVQSEFNAIAGGVDNWQRTIEGRRAKIDALTGTFELQQQKISTIAAELKKANEALEADPSNLNKARKVSDLETKLNNAKAAAANTKLEIEKINAIKFSEFERKMTTIGDTLQGFGRKFSLYIGGPLSALGIKSYNAALDYESAMARFQVASQGTEEQMAAMKETALKMSTEIPMGFVEIIDLMTTLSEADVPVDKLESVARVMGALGATSDVSVEQSAKAIMQFLTVTGSSIEDVERMGSTLLDLGRNSVATGGEIFEMAQRMASTGSLAGFSAPEILSMAAAISSMGIEAEAGGTSASKLMKAMQLAAETGKGLNDEVKKSGDVVMGFTTAMGLSEEQFKASWGKSPVNTMLSFFDSLKNGSNEGKGSVLAMLDAMDLTEIRLSNLTASAAKNPDFFERMLGTAATAWEENKALAEAADIAYSTTAASTETSLNKIENAAADVGENVAETVQPMIEKVAELVAEFGKLDEATQSRWVLVAGALITLGPAAMGIGSVATSIGKMAGFLGKLDNNGVSRWTKIFDFLTGPIGGPLAAAVAVGGSVYLLDQYMSSISDNTVNVVDRLKNIEIGLDETKYKAVSDALAEIKAQADALSGENGEYNKNVSTAVQAGYGTESMFGAAIGYEALMSEQDMAAIAGRYGDQINKLNGMIGEASREADRKALATERDALQAQWDTDVSNAKQRYMDKVSALVGGMMQAEPEAKAALEQAARDYDVLAALSKAMSDVMAADITPEESDQVWKNFFTPEILGQYFEGLRYEDLVPGAAALDLENKLLKGLTETLGKAGGENSMINTLFQAILDNPLTASSLDLTKVSGSLDGIVELLDLKAASEKLGTDYGNGLTDGFADSITTGTVSVTTAATGMAGAADEAVRARLGMHSPSTVMIAHGINTATSWAMGIELGAPITTAAMMNLGATLDAIAAAKGASAGQAYGRAFSTSASIELTAAVSKIKREIDNINLRLNRGYGSI